MGDIRFSVIRNEGRGVTTIACVRAVVSDDFDRSEHMSESGAVQGAIMSAVTDWINETQEGKDAWEDSCEDFNIGDLGCNLDSESLKSYLKRYCIESLDIDIADGSSSNWTFDEVLVNTHDLKGVSNV